MQRRTLVVDDEAADCELIHEVLSSTGIDTLTLSSSAEAEPYIRDEKFSALPFDLRMPPPDGLELTRKARSPGINQTTPIILVSDDQSTAAVSQGFAAGASFFLYKPIDKARLLKLVRATQGAIEHERRRFRRVSLQSKVRIDSEKGEWEGETIDVSLNGLLVKGSRSLPAGSPVHVSLYLASETRPVVGFGSVVRVLGGNRMGIQLNRLTMTESGRLQDFLLPLILQQGPDVRHMSAQS